MAFSANDLTTGDIKNKYKKNHILRGLSRCLSGFKEFPSTEKLGLNSRTFNNLWVLWKKKQLVTSTINNTMT